MSRNHGNRPSSIHWSWGLGACLLLTLATTAQLNGAEITQVKINECNSDLGIGVAPMAPVENEIVNLTLTISSTDARDNMDNPVVQVFDKATFAGDCQQPPGIPCTPAVMASVMYQGNLGGTCPGATANPLGNGVVEFDFVPDLELLNPAPATPISCTVTFDVIYSAAGDYALQANTSGVCQNPLGGVSSDTTVTSALTVFPSVPTLGGVGLVILALLLLGGAWIILRRRQAPAGGIGP